MPAVAGAVTSGWTVDFCDQMMSVSRAQLLKHEFMPDAEMCVVSNDDRFTDVSFEHWLNIYDMVVTLDVLNAARSSDVRLLQNENIDVNVMTFAVLNVDTSIEVRLLHIENIEPIFVTFDVSNDDTSIDARGVL
jgi:hypothetical protein